MSNHTCLDEELFAAYFDGLLNETQEEQFHQELHTCADCLAFASSLGVVLRSETPNWQATAMPMGLTQRAIDLWPAEVGVSEAISEGLKVALRWVGQALEPIAEALQPMELASATMRGDAARALPEEQLRFQATLGDLPVEIDVEVDGDREVALTVKPMSAPPVGLILRVSSSGETRAISSFGQVGSTVSALPVGAYELSLEQGSTPLGILHLELHA